MPDLLALTDRGLYCSAGDFYVDPWRPVDRAIVTHAHADHARQGMNRYLTCPEGEIVLRTRMGSDAAIETVSFGKKVNINGVIVSLHPAGHILGSAQVRVELDGEVWVVSGDYKTEPDPTCTAFEPIRCHTFITESTFGLPIYQWPDQASVFAEINAWWRMNADVGKTSLLCGYSLGKAQRLIAGVDASIGTIFCHGAVETCNRNYRASGIPLPETQYAGTGERGGEGVRGIIGDCAAVGNRHTLDAQLGDVSTAFASGWMLVRGQRRRRAVDRGFVLSDHADWPGLFDAINATGCERVYVTHGSRAVMVRRLIELGYEAHSLETWFEGEQDSGGAEAEEEALLGEATNE